jgi:hypothetical protein
MCCAKESADSCIGDVVVVGVVVAVVSSSGGGGVGGVHPPAASRMLWNREKENAGRNMPMVMTMPPAHRWPMNPMKATIITSGEGTTLPMAMASTKFWVVMNFASCGGPQSPNGECHREVWGRRWGWGNDA